MSQDDGQRCPSCDGPVGAIVTSGPGKHHITPCGCRVGPLRVADLVEGRAISAEQPAVAEGVRQP